MTKLHGALDDERERIAVLFERAGWISHACALRTQQPIIPLTEYKAALQILEKLDASSPYRSTATANDTAVTAVRAAVHDTNAGRNELLEQLRTDNIVDEELQDAVAQLLEKDRKTRSVHMDDEMCDVLVRMRDALVRLLETHRKTRAVHMNDEMRGAFVQLSDTLLQLLEKDRKARAVHMGQVQQTQEALRRAIYAEIRESFMSALSLGEAAGVDQSSSVEDGILAIRRQQNHHILLMVRKTPYIPPLPGIDDATLIDSINEMIASERASVLAQITPDASCVGGDVLAAVEKLTQHTLAEERHRVVELIRKSDSDRRFMAHFLPPECAIRYPDTTRESSDDTKADVDTSKQPSTAVEANSTSGVDTPTKACVCNLPHTTCALHALMRPERCLVSFQGSTRVPTGALGNVMPRVPTGALSNVMHCDCGHPGGWCDRKRFHNPLDCPSRARGTDSTTSSTS